MRHETHIPRHSKEMCVNRYSETLATTITCMNEAVAADEAGVISLYVSRVELEHGATSGRVDRMIRQPASGTTVDRRQVAAQLNHHGVWLTVCGSRCVVCGRPRTQRSRMACGRPSTQSSRVVCKRMTGCCIAPPSRCVVHGVWSVVD